MTSPVAVLVIDAQDFLTDLEMLVFAQFFANKCRVPEIRVNILIGSDRHLDAVNLEGQRQAAYGDIRGFV